jgi:alpha-glucuronidase
MFKYKCLFFIAFSLFFTKIQAEDGYDLWLRYVPVKDEKLLKEYQNQIKGISVLGKSETAQIIREELSNALSKMLKKRFNLYDKMPNVFAVSASENAAFLKPYTIENDLKTIGNEGFIIFSDKKNIIITANTKGGVLYGVFHFLRLIQTGQSLKNLKIIEKPKVKHRILNH